MLKNWTRIYGRTAALIGALTLGMLLPQAQVLSWLIQYLVMLMLFFSFLDVSFSVQTFRPSTFLVLAANVLIAFASYGALQAFDHNLAVVAFLTGLTPTATAAPVVMGFLGGQVDYVAAAMLLTNVSVACLVPFLLPWAAGASMAISTWEVLQAVVVVIGVPLVASQLAHRLPHGAQAVLRRGKRLSFPLWLAALVLIAAKTTAFVLNNLAAAPTLLAIAATALVICAVNFSVGALVGGPTYRREASQALGQKNTTFAIWLGLTFLSPLAAMGPAFYVVFHNLYNSFQLYRFEKDREQPPAAALTPPG